MRDELREAHGRLEEIRNRDANEGEETGKDEDEGGAAEDDEQARPAKEPPTGEPTKEDPEAAPQRDDEDDESS